MNIFLTKLAMLILFLLAVTCGWAAVTMTFSVSLWNIILGILAAFFLFRALEFADKVNKFGPYAEDPQANKEKRDDESLSSANPEREDNQEEN